MNRQQELNRLLSQEPKKKNNHFFDEVLWIIVCFGVCFGVVLAYCYGPVVDAFCRNHPIEIGVSLIVFGCIGSVMFARYLHNHWFI